MNTELDVIQGKDHSTESYEVEVFLILATALSGRSPLESKGYSIWSHVVQYRGARYWRCSAAWGCQMWPMLRAEVMQKSMKILHTKKKKKTLYDIGAYFCGVW